MLLAGLAYVAGIVLFPLMVVAAPFIAAALALAPMAMVVAGTFVVERAYALVQAAAALRGWLLAPSPEADEIHDPYGAPIPYFRSVGDEISKALDPVVTALTGVPAR